MKTLKEVTEQIQKINEHREEFEEKKQEMLKNLKIQIEQLFKNLFKAVPSLKVVHWQQYTPYWQDGDECVFNIRSVNFYNHVPVYYPVEAENLDMKENQWGFSLYKSQWYQKDYDESIHQVTKEEYDLFEFFTDTLNENKDFLKDLLGDHVAVILTDQGISTEEIEHS